MLKIKERLSNIPLFESLFALKGNHKVLIYVELLWRIPNALFVPYATLYMYELGIHDQQIGWLLSVQGVCQVVYALLSGVITDKLGRRKTCFIFETLAWSFPLLIWVFARNFWYFLVAAILNSLVQIAQNAWSALMIEDGDPKHFVNMNTWVIIWGFMAVFLAPVASLLVDRFTVVPAVRAIYLFAFVVMTTKFILQFCLIKETSVGRARIEETRGVPIFKLLAGYKDVLIKIIHSSPMKVALLLKLLIFVAKMITDNFMAIYVTQDLGVPESYVGFFPMGQAIMSLFFLFVIQRKFDVSRCRPIMIFGSCFYIAANLWLAFSQPGHLWMVVVYILLDAVAYAVVFPRNSSLISIFIDKQERARAYALINTATYLGVSMFGWLVGFCSEINRSISFLINAGLFTIYLCVIYFSKAIRDYDRSIEG